MALAIEKLRLNLLKRMFFLYLLGNQDGKRSRRWMRPTTGGMDGLRIDLYYATCREALERALALTGGVQL